jgi:hypothetical protein
MGPAESAGAAGVAARDARRVRAQEAAAVGARRSKTCTSS